MLAAVFIIAIAVYTCSLKATFSWLAMYTVCTRKLKLKADFAQEK